MSDTDATSLDARIVRFRSQGRADDAEPLARALLAAGRFREAAEVGEAHAEDAQSFESWQFVAEARRADADVVGAQRAWLRCIRIRPEVEGPYVAVIDGLLARDDRERAKKLAERALSSCPPSAALRERAAALGVGPTAPPAPVREPTPAPVAAPELPVQPVREPTPAPVEAPALAALPVREPTPAPVAASELPALPVREPTPVVLDSSPPLPPLGGTPTVAVREPTPPVGDVAAVGFGLARPPSAVGTPAVATSTVISSPVRMVSAIPAVPPPKPTAVVHGPRPSEAPKLDTSPGGFRAPTPAVPGAAPDFGSDEFEDEATRVMALDDESLRAFAERPTTPLQSAPTREVPALLPMHDDGTSESELIEARSDEPRSPYETSGATVRDEALGGPAKADESTRPFAIELGDDGETVVVTPHDVPRQSPRAPRRRLGWLAAALVLGAGAAVATGVVVRDRNERARFVALERATTTGLSADVERVVSGAAGAASAARRAERDLALEAVLVEASTVGGVTLDRLRQMRVAARAKGVGADVLRLVDAAITQADRSAPRVAIAADTLTMPAGSPPALSIAAAALASAHGGCAPALRTVEGRSEGAARWVSVELLRCLGRSRDASARAVRVEGAPRLELAAASIALDEGRGVDAARIGRVAVSSDAEKVYRQSVLARAFASVGRAREAAAALDAAPAAAVLGAAVTLERAAAELALGRHDEAVAALVSAFGSQPEHVRARRLLATAWAAAGKGDEALALLSADDPTTLALRATAALHAQPDAARAAADAIAALGDGADAALRAVELRLRLVGGEAPFALLGRAEALRAEHPSSRPVFLAFAAVAAAGERWELLESAVDPAMAGEPEVAAYLARAAMRRAAVADVERLLGLLEASAPDASETLVVRGYLEFDRGQLDEAAATYRALSERDDVVLEGPAHAVGLSGLLLVDLARGQLDAAQATDARLASEADLPVVRRARGRYAIARGRAADVLPALEAEALDPHATPQFLVLFGDALFATGAVDRAAEAYREALALDGAMPEAHLGVASVLVRAERYAEANTEIIRCRRTLDGRPRGPAAEARYFTLFGRALLGLGELEEARYALRRAVALPGTPAEAHFFLGESLAGQNSPDARSAYERYLSLDPEGAFAERAQRAIR